MAGSTKKYTPTEDDLREVYRGQLIATDKPNTYEIIDEQQADEEFDRFLTNLKKQAAAEERKRLLDLHLRQSKKMGYSKDFIIEALKGKVWKEETDGNDNE